MATKKLRPVRKRPPARRKRSASHAIDDLARIYPPASARERREIAAMIDRGILKPGPDYGKLVKDFAPVGMRGRPGSDLIREDREAGW